MFGDPIGISRVARGACVHSSFAPDFVHEVYLVPSLGDLSYQSVARLALAHSLACCLFPLRLFCHYPPLALQGNNHRQPKTDIILNAALPQVLEEGHQDSVPLGPPDPIGCVFYVFRLEDDDDKEEGGGDDDSSSPRSESDPVWTSPDNHGPAGCSSEDSIVSSSPLWSPDPIWREERNVAAENGSSENSIPSPLRPSDPICLLPVLDLAESDNTDDSEESPICHRPELRVAASDESEDGEASPTVCHPERHAGTSADTEDSFEPLLLGLSDPLWFPIPDLLEAESDRGGLRDVGATWIYLDSEEEEEEEGGGDNHDADSTPWAEWDRARSCGDDGVRAGKVDGRCSWAERMSRLSEWLGF